MKRYLLYGGLGVLSFLVFVVAFAPASLYWNREMESRAGCDPQKKRRIFG